MGANSKTVNVDGFGQETAIQVTPATSGAGRTLSYVSGTKNSNGNNSLISAPGAGVKIVLVSVVLQNESSTVTTMILQDDTGGTAILRVLGQNQGDGVAITFPTDARPKLTANKPLNLNLSGANSCGYSIFYYTE